MFSVHALIFVRGDVKVQKAVGEVVVKCGDHGMRLMCNRPSSWCLEGWGVSGSLGENVISHLFACMVYSLTRV